MADILDSAARAAALVEKGPLAMLAVIAIAALIWISRLYVRDAREHREAVRLLYEKHAAELATVNDARLRLAAEFEGTIRALLVAAGKKRPRPPLKAVERKE